MTTKNYYDVLGLTSRATPEEIKKAFRQLASKHHPDKYTNSSDSERKKAEEKFKNIEEAYRNLTSEIKTEPFKFDENFENYDSLWKNHNYEFHKFEEFLNRNNRQSVHITLAEAYTGTTKRLNNETIFIPKGIRSGSKLHTSKQIITIEITPDSKFKRSDNDLLVDLTISAIEAILGITIDLRHLDNSIMQFTVPSGIQPGQVLRLAGKGMPNPENNDIGDILVRISVTIPRNISTEQKTSLEKFVSRSKIFI